MSPTASGSVLLKDVASVEDTFKTRTGLVRVDEQEGIALVVVKLPDANVISTVDGVRHKVEASAFPILTPHGSQGAIAVFWPAASSNGTGR